MQRRQFLMGVGATGAAIAGAAGTGAFSYAELNNQLQLDNQAADVDGFVALAPADAKISDGGKAIDASGNFYDPDVTGNQYVNRKIITVNGDGSVVIDLNGNGAEGFNAGSVYYFDNALQIYIQKKNDQVTYTDGPWEVSFGSLPAGVEAYEADSRSGPFSKVLEDGEGVLVGFKVTADDLASTQNNNLTATIQANLL